MNEIPMPSAEWSKCFGLTSPPVMAARPLGGSELAAVLLEETDALSQRLISIPNENSYLVMLYFADVEHRDVLVHGKPTEYRTYPQGSICLVDLENGAKIEVRGSLNALAFRIPRSFLKEFGPHTGLGAVGLKTCRGAGDIIIHHLGEAMVSMLDLLSSERKLLLEHVFQALVAHLVHHYSDARDNGSSAFLRLTIH